MQTKVGDKIRECLHFGPKAVVSHYAYRVADIHVDHRGALPVIVKWQGAQMRKPHPVRVTVRSWVLVRPKE